MAAILLVVSLLFVCIMIIKHKLKLKLCVLCAAILISWLALYSLYKMGKFHDPVLIAILMGQSVTGIYYALDRRVLKDLKVFTFPFFLTLTASVYFLINGLAGSFLVFVLLLALWVLGYVVFVNRKDPGKKHIAESVINCCQDR